MKILFSILLIVTILLPNLKKACLLINFKVNQKQITDAFCENKEKPQIKCNGKCFLTKELKKADKEEKQQTPNTSKDKAELVLFIAPFSVMISQPINSLSVKPKFTRKQDVCFSSHLTEVFHPPQST